VVAPDILKRFRDLQILSALPPDQRTHCPKCKILAALPDDNTDDDVNSTNVTCANPECKGFSFCYRCQVPWHKGQTCKQYAKARAGSDEATTKLIAATSKTCPGCGVPTTHYKAHACTYLFDLTHRFNHTRFTLHTAAVALIRPRTPLPQRLRVDYTFTCIAVCFHCLSRVGHHITPGTGCPRCHTHWCYMCRAPMNPKTCACPLFCTATCGCPICPDCRPGHPCKQCTNEGDPCPACHPPAHAAH
jgi:hypothetical protein